METSKSQTRDLFTPNAQSLPNKGILAATMNLLQFGDHFELSPAQSDPHCAISHMAKSQSELSTWAGVVIPNHRSQSPSEFSSSQRDNLANFLVIGWLGWNSRDHSGRWQTSQFRVEIIVHSYSLSESLVRSNSDPFIQPWARNSKFQSLVHADRVPCEKLRNSAVIMNLLQFGDHFELNKSSFQWIIALKTIRSQAELIWSLNLPL